MAGRGEGPGPTRDGSSKAGTASPRLRCVDLVRVPDARHGMVAVLNDGEGVGESVAVPPPLDAALPWMDGRRSTAIIAAAASRSSGVEIVVTEVEALVAELDEACLLDNDRFRVRQKEMREAFARLTVREASHAGGAYHADPKRLSAFIESDCLGASELQRPAGEVAALIAPHMDLWRAASGYGKAYGALAAGLGEEADTFFLLGTCHAGMRSPFALTRKAFATPFGNLSVDDAVVSELAAASAFDVFEDEYQHVKEHSIEFQAVLLHHLLGAERARRARIVPILCGLERSQSSRRDPTQDDQANGFLSALSDAVARLEGKAVVIAGADLAHVGPRFGDATPLDAEGREALRARDEETLARTLALDAQGFFEDTTSDLSRRRVCGVAPIYTLLRLGGALGVESARASLAGYTQHVDPREGSIVSHASISFARC